MLGTSTHRQRPAARRVSPRAPFVCPLCSIGELVRDQLNPVGVVLPELPDTVCCLSSEPLRSVTTGAGRAPAAPADILRRVSARCGLSGTCALELAVSAKLDEDAAVNDASSGRWLALALPARSFSFIPTFALALGLSGGREASTGERARGRRGVGEGGDCACEVDRRCGRRCGCRQRGSVGERTV